MLYLRLILGPAALAMVLMASSIAPIYAANGQWSYVTNAGEIRSFEASRVPEAIPEGIVVFVGEDIGSTPASVDGCPVVAIDTDSVGLRNPGRLTQAKEIPDLSSAGIIWPDKDGRIVAAKSDSSDVRSVDGSRNPWRRPSNVASRSLGVEISCGALVIGGETGPIAILNGRVVRAADTLEGFVVRRIVQEGVIIEHSGALYMVPRGKRAIITIPED